MRTCKMVGYFSVPLDRALLREYRKKAGFSRAQDFDEELKRRGYRVSYVSIEYSHGSKADRDKIRGDSAEIISSVLGLDPNMLFPGYDEAKAASKNIDPTPLEKAKKHMDVLFKVPVDLDLLKYYREAKGYSSKRQASAALHRQGSGISYYNVECPARCQGAQKYIRGDVAAEVAGFFGLDPNVLFPGYDEAKAAAEDKVKTDYYKPFSSVDERNAAILDMMEKIRTLSLGFGNLRCEGVSLGRDEVIAMAYEALCEIADKALKKGIPNGVGFGGYAYESVRNTLRQCYKASKYFNLDIFSLEAYTHAYDLPGSFNLEEYLVLRDEAWRAVQALSEEQKQIPRIRQLIKACFPEANYV